MKKVTRNDVIMAIANSGANGVSALELAEALGTSVSVAINHASRLYRDKIISKKRRMLSGRSWEIVYYSNTADETPIEQPANVRVDDPAPEVSKHKPNQNHEGYNDPTATEAIKRMERYGGFMPGGIYKTTNGEAFLVLTTYPDTVLGYRIDFVPNATDTDSEVTWKVGPNSAIVHTHRVCSVPFKRLLLGNMTKCPFESFRDILRKSPFNSCKKVEVPVEGAITEEAYERLAASNRQFQIRLEDERENVRKLNDEIVRWEKAQESWRIEEKDLHEKNRLVAEQWYDLAKALDTGSSSIPELIDRAKQFKLMAEQWYDLATALDTDFSSISELIGLAKQYKDLAEAPIDGDKLGVSIADHERLKGERDVYKSIVDRIVEYWTA